MTVTFKPKDIDRLLAEADDLIRQIDADLIRDMDAEHRIQFEMQAQRLKKLRAEARQKSSTEEAPENGRYGEGMHQAILDIVTAMKNLGRNLQSTGKSVDPA